MSRVSSASRSAETVFASHPCRAVVADLRRMMSSTTAITSSTTPAMTKIHPHGVELLLDDDGCVVVDVVVVVGVVGATVAGAAVVAGVVAGGVVVAGRAVVAGATVVAGAFVAVVTGAVVTC